MMALSSMFDDDSPAQRNPRDEKNGSDPFFALAGPWVLAPWHRRTNKMGWQFNCHPIVFVVRS
jgi:hypothetical protein